MQKLVIVESPTKAKTISKFLGKGYSVQSSFGHVRDLPKGKFGVDVEHDFEPKYVVPTKSRKTVTALKKTAKKAEEVLFATDEDREGEAISWHLAQLLDVKSEKAKRIVFHEITPEAITAALAHPRGINQHLVDAQQARRILDRLVGYELSPFLWRKITKGLSAGRVQSVALRLIVEREREIEAFKAVEYWTIEGTFHPSAGAFKARLYKSGKKALDKFAISTEQNAKEIVKALESTTYRICDVVKKDTKRSALPPFTTSTLQQEANKRLRFSAKQTMMIAQQLYEGVEMEGGMEGLITYMRTDSVSLSERFLLESKEAITHLFGERYAVGPKSYATKSKLAQEAHEAIRPTVSSRTPDMLRTVLTEQQHKLYELIWRRALASQMPDALFEATVIDVESVGAPDAYIFRAAGQTLHFDGFTAVYPLDLTETLLPMVERGSDAPCELIEPIQHFTKPPARYSEAALVKALEEYGIGRPSTYAPTISTIIARNYVQREDSRLKPTELACMVNDLLVQHFPSVVDYQFTAHMEDSFDEIAQGTKEWVPILREFYEPFKKLLMEKDVELTKDKVLAETTDVICDKCSKAMVVRMSRYGKFLACSGFPECKNTKQIEGNEDGESSDSDGEEAPLCEKCGGLMAKKRGRFGMFWGCSNYPECKSIKPLAKDVLGPCPKCEKGSIVRRRTKRGKIFFGCNKYPDCDYTSWTKPGEEKKADNPELTDDIK